MDIPAILDHAVRSAAAPGLVAMATDGRDTLVQHAAGVRTLGDPAAMTLDSVFWIASMTKAITAVAVLQLVEQGRIGLRQPLGAIVPHLAHPQVLDGCDAAGQPRLRPARREVTLHDLLTHTSGFVYETWNADIGRYLKATGRPGVGSGLVAALQQPLAFDPGGRWEYGVGMDWAGQVIEALTGQTLGRYLAEHVTEPLGMADTWFGRPQGDEPGAGRVVTLHHREPGGGLRAGRSDRPARPELESGGGGLYSTGPDYLKVLAMLLRGGDGLLRPETVDLMARNQLDGLEVGRLDSVVPAISNAIAFPGAARHWGYGGLINTTPGPAGRGAGSLSWGGLPNCYYWLDRQRGVAGLLLAQVLPFADPAMLNVLDLFESAVYAGWR